MKASTISALLVGAAAAVAVAVLTSGKSTTAPGPARRPARQPPPRPAPQQSPGPARAAAWEPAPQPSQQPPLSRAREAVAQAALSQVGSGNAKRYWDDVLPGIDVGEADWCGAGALWSLHQAGLALDRQWKLGSGFLLTPPALPTTTQPALGDIAYFDHKQHHAVVVGVAPGLVELVNFNGTAGLVSRSSIQPAQATAFFSIAPLISTANA